MLLLWLERRCPPSVANNICAMRAAAQRGLECIILGSVIIENMRILLITSGTGIANKNLQPNHYSRNVDAVCARRGGGGLREAVGIFMPLFYAVAKK